MPKCAHPAVRNDNVPPKRGMDRRLVATTPRADTLDFGLWSCYTVIPCPRLRGGRRETEKVIAREDGVCVCLLLQDLLQSCSRGGRRRVEDIMMCDW